MKMDLMSIEATLQESLREHTTKSPPQIGTLITPLLNAILESGVYTDLIIECKLPNWQKCVRYQLNKGSKHTRVTIGLSLKYNKHGKLSLRLSEKNVCSLRPLEGGSFG